MPEQNITFVFSPAEFGLSSESFERLKDWLGDNADIDMDIVQLILERWQEVDDE